MKRLISLLCLILATLSMKAQDDQAVEGLMTQRQISCTDVQYNAIRLIPGMHDLKQKDSLLMLLDYWSRKCNGMTEPLFSFSVIYAIEQGRFTEEIYEKTALPWYMSMYKSTLDYLKAGNFPDKEMYVTYYNNIREMAKGLQNDVYLTTVEKWLVDYYASPNDSLIDNVLTKKYDSTVLQSQFKAQRDIENDRSGVYAVVYGGAWIPMGKLSTVGVHPFLGLGAGFRGKRLLIGLGINFSFLRSPNPYKVMEEDSVFTTTHFFGGYIGLDGAYELIKKDKSDFCILAGIGFDGFDVLSIGEGEDEISKSLGSLNLNVGVAYKYKVSKSNNLLGVYAKYNFVNYKNTGGTDLSGNTISIGVFFEGNQKPSWQNRRYQYRRF